MNARLTAIPSELGKLYLKRNELTSKQWDLENAISTQQRVLIPAEGWAGKNQEQRDISREMAYASDPVLQSKSKELHDAKQALMDIEANIKALEDERRSLEWDIRSQMVMAMANHQTSREEIEPSDDLQRAAMDHEIFPPEQSLVDDTIPF